MSKLNTIFRLWQRGFGKLADAAPRGSAVEKIARDGEATSGVLLELLGGTDDHGEQKAITTTCEVADEGGS
ncbi:MAG TPA: hypothetical protein VG963_04010 [Polyangiaceae bacterium]|nr:hypothetical protein [Polyangiaceae bacterium]HVZ31563.1 hypothetical protein [Polyangiaceae bacterium]